HWTDSRLAWKGQFNSSLDHVHAITLPASSLWQPDASFYDVVQLSDATEGRAILSVMSSGIVLRSTGMILSTKCSMYMQMFPFDKQNCFVRLSSLQQATGSTQIRIKSLYENDEPTRYVMKSSEFCILWVRLEN
uniref:Neur_chan_LBD domain-containing protein n=1 Tax=Macrostomum lignano TaxID=282301 RepID=A0A1I8H2A5_9PLAT